MALGHQHGMPSPVRVSGIGEAIERRGARAAEDRRGSAERWAHERHRAEAERTDDQTAEPQRRCEPGEGAGGAHPTTATAVLVQEDGTLASGGSPLGGPARATLVLHNRIGHGHRKKRASAHRKPLSIFTYRNRAP